VTDTRDERAEADFKYTRYDDSPGSTHELVVGLVPEGSSVLEFGPATGYMTKVLAQRLGCRVTGIELDPGAAAQAQTHAERMIVGDAEALDLDEHLSGELFDVGLFADVLEHLRDPAGLLSRVRPFVAEQGTVIASIPNVAHISVRLALLGGEFRYRTTGLLDDTHLRFFTRESIVDLFESSGFVVSRWLRRRIELRDSEIDPGPEISAELISRFRSDPEATTYQFVVAAVPSEAAAQLSDVRAQLADMRATLRSRTLQELDDAQRELDLVRRAHDAQGRHLIAERLAFADQIAELEGVIGRLKEEVEWRKGVMEEFEGQLERIRSSRAYRYSAPIRGLLGGRRVGG
jgi:2-polyprenyl-3-methyl-5-hydroxy-6-metoxy-1,4-benzoquinol methylase